MTDKTCFLFTILFVALFGVLSSCKEKPAPDKQPVEESLWHGWNQYQIKPEDTLVKLGHDIIDNTAYYFGPEGVVSHISNGMNCKNCHLESGILPWAVNFSAVASTYPKYREVSGAIQDIPGRVNDCFQRSLNGSPLDTNSHEMKAILAYIHWVGDDVPKGKRPRGVAIMDIPLLDRAADTVRGRQVFINTCQRCHGADGEGQKNIQGYGYVYPPLWGPHSYNSAASTYRVSRLAGFVKNNMPYLEATYDKPVLSNEDAWDVAAYISSQPRPTKDVSKDWPDIKTKPFDYPWGPYSDTFSEKQHKYGPFKPIKAVQK
jgi:thiosulfate dehydrogenase